MKDDSVVVRQLTPANIRSIPASRFRTMEKKQISVKIPIDL